MEMTVLIEPKDGRFRASTSQPITMETEGASREEALERLRDLAISRRAGGELVSVSLPSGDSRQPWMKFAGIWKDNPDFDQFVRNVAEYRHTVDEPASET